MENKQKKLLYEIAKWRSDRFLNNMSDHWEPSDYAFNRLCNEKIKELEN